MPRVQRRSICPAEGPARESVAASTFHPVNPCSVTSTETGRIDSQTTVPSSTDTQICISLETLDPLMFLEDCSHLEDAEPVVLLHDALRHRHPGLKVVSAAAGRLGVLGGGPSRNEGGPGLAEGAELVAKGLDARLELLGRPVEGANLLALGLHELLPLFRRNHRRCAEMGN